MRAKWENFSEEELNKIAFESRNNTDFLCRLGYASSTASSRSTQIIKDISASYPEILKILRKEEYLGQKFGRYTVKEIIGDTFNISWLCKCDCGTEKIEKPHRLLSGHTQSCGCLKEKDLTGQVFGKLTVLRRSSKKSKDGHIRWICHCVCGNECDVLSNALKSGGTQSCGCTQLSSGEGKIKKILQQMNVKYSTQYSFNELKGKNFLRFDFCILDKDEIKCLIEYQGEQHYTPIEYFGGQEVFHRQQEYDNLKREYCKNNNIKLIEIPYWDYNKINAEYLLQKIFERGE